MRSIIPGDGGSMLRTHHNSIAASFFALVVIFGSLSLSVPAQTAIQPGGWTWMGGSSTVPYSGPGGEVGGQPGSYGALGVPDAANNPGGRTGGGSWTDKDGNLWLFGGVGYDSIGNRVILNDLWMFNSSTHQWTWESGSSTSTCTMSVVVWCGAPGVYGTLNVPAVGNSPGGRVGETTWIDGSGNLWLFGGQGTDSGSPLNLFMLNDLWRFRPSTREWTWIGGSSTGPAAGGLPLPGLPGIYGTSGTAAPGNFPGGRMSASGWSDGSGDLWLFGGSGYDSRGNEGLLDDLWRFNPSTSEWAWMGGSATIPNTDWPGSQGGPVGVYGTLGSADPANHPGGRSGGTSWIDASGNLWLYAGLGWDSAGNQGQLDDVWMYHPATNEWAWMAGSSALPPGIQDGMGIKIGCQPPIFGTFGTAGPGNVPGCGFAEAIWADGGQSLWLFGGGGYDSAGRGGVLNDIWEFDLNSLEWSWMNGGTQEFPYNWPGVYGTPGVSAAGNVPGFSYQPTEWTGVNEQFWLFGGLGMDSLGHQGYLNSLWVYSLPPAALPTFSLAPGTYTTPQTVTISDTVPTATIYYTADGTTPTSTSAVFRTPITISSTETLNAIASANGYSVSTVASATYTINLPAPDFSVAATPATMTVAGGQSGTFTVSVTPANGFSSATTFSCSGLPAGVTCTFSPTSVTPSGKAASTTLTIATSASSAALRRTTVPFSSGAALAAILCCIGWRKRRRLPVLILIAVAAIAFSALTACGGGSTGSPTPPPHQPTTSIVTVTATCGSLQHSTSLSLTVD